MVPRRELILRLLAKTSEHEQTITYTRIQKSVYLLNRFMKKEFGKGTSYSFDSFLSHSGPYDEDLQRDLDVWLMVGLLKDQGSPVKTVEGPSKYFKTHDLRTTQWGRVYLENAIADIITEYWGRNSVRRTEDFFSELNKKPEYELMKTASKAWAEEHPEKMENVKIFISSFPE